MTKNGIVRLLSVLFAIITAFSWTSTAFATDVDSPINEEVPTRYSTIQTTSSSITISGVTATCVAALKAQYSTTLKITMSLQKKNSSGTYETVKTWTDSKTGTTLNLGGSKVINPLKTYRIKVSFTAGNETFTTYKYA